MCILGKVPLGVKLLRPAHDIKVVGVENEHVRLVQVAGSQREQEGEQDAEPEVRSGPEEVVVSINGSVEPPRGDTAVDSLETRISCVHC